jgi:hypothetical protein
MSWSFSTGWNILCRNRSVPAPRYGHRLPRHHRSVGHLQHGMIARLIRKLGADEVKVVRPDFAALERLVDVVRAFEQVQRQPQVPRPVRMRPRQPPSRRVLRLVVIGRIVEGLDGGSGAHDIASDSFPVSKE